MLAYCELPESLISGAKVTTKKFIFHGLLLHYTTDFMHDSITNLQCEETPLRRVLDIFKGH